MKWKGNKSYRFVRCNDFGFEEFLEKEPSRFLKKVVEYWLKSQKLSSFYWKINDRNYKI